MNAQRRFRSIAGRVVALAVLPALAACSSSTTSDGASDVARATVAEELASSSHGGGAPTGARDLILEIEDHRLLGDPRLSAFLRSDDPSVAAAAAIAAGRIGDPSLTASVLPLLGARDARVREAAALGLSLLGGAGVEEALAARLADERHAAARRAILLTLGHVGTAASIPVVTAPLLADDATEIQTAAAEALATMVRNHVAPPSDPAVVARLLSFAGAAPGLRSIASSFALSALAGAKATVPEAGVIAALRAARTPSARAFLVRTLSSIRTPGAFQAIADALAGDASPRVRADACRFIASAGATPLTLGALSAALHDRSPEVVVASATAIGGLGTGASSLVPVLFEVFDGSRSPWVRATLVATFAAVDAESARARIEQALTDAFPVRLAAIAALGALGTAADAVRLTELAGDPEGAIAFAALEAITTLDASRITDAVKDRARTALARRDFEITVGVADVAATFGLTDFAEGLRAAYDAFPGPGNLNARLEIAFALGIIGSDADLPLLERAIGDDEHLVAQTAADSFQALTGQDVSGRVRPQSSVRTRTPSHEEVEEALRSEVVLETTRGRIVMRMVKEAPLSATNFVRLASSGFYDGLTFHRVVPNFVAQGGDPRGDGVGGSDRLVREEISTVPHTRGTVGMATEGKDTGSSQFFVNEGWNVSLDGRFTVFAKVVSGIDAAEHLQIGDRILSARVHHACDGDRDEQRDEE